MKHVRGVNALATAAMLLAAMTACTNSDQDPAGSPTPTSSKPSTSSSTPASDSEGASEAATSVVRRFYAIVDNLRQQPARSESQLAQVAASIQLDAQEHLLDSQRAKGLRQVGDTTLIEVKVQSINLDPGTGRSPTASIDVCWDVRNVDIVNATGKSVVTPERASVGWTRLTVANYDSAANSPGKWRVVSGEDLKKAPCVAS